MSFNHLNQMTREEYNALPKMGESTEIPSRHPADATQADEIGFIVTDKDEISRDEIAFTVKKVRFVD